MQRILVSPNFNCSTEIQMFICFDTAVGPKDKFVINIVLILIAERDSSAVGGHNSSYRNAINPSSSADHGQNVYIINLRNVLTAARPSIFISNVCPVICLYIHQSPP
jgi:hypothetical protein